MISSSGHINSVASNIYVNNISKANSKSDSSAGDAGTNDQIVLSSESQEFASYLNNLRTMPDVRMDKVNFYSDKINNNEYQVDSGNIAEKILNGCFV